MRLLFRAGIGLVYTLHLLACSGQFPANNSISTHAQVSDDFDEVMPFSYKMPSHLNSIDTSPGWTQNGQKISLTGIVYQRDGKMPASDVILYYYHTDVDGIYATNPDEPRNMPKNRLGQTHGYIRGWVKTGVDGKYTINTVMPGSYPSRLEPEHVHITVKERNMEEPYYLDDFVFDHSRLLSFERRNRLENRGGSGVIRFVEGENLWIGERDLILGLHIPNYPISAGNETDSGKGIGEDLSSFTPVHAFGPDKGTKTCSICKYGWYQGILYFVGNRPDWSDIRKWLVFLDLESQRREAYLKTYFIYGDENDYDGDKRISFLAQMGNELQLKNIALTFVPSFTDESSEIHLNGIDQNCENSFILYRRSKIVGRFMDIKPINENFEMLKALLDDGQNEYFRLPRAKKE